MEVTASQFFEACESCKGWDGCSSFCEEGATFIAQSEPLAEIKYLKDYVGIMS